MSFLGDGNGTTSVILYGPICYAGNISILVDILPASVGILGRTEGVPVYLNPTVGVTWSAKLPMQHLVYFKVFQDDEAIASGVKLPSGQFALSWYGRCHSHGVFPSFDVFKGMQDQRVGRTVKQMSAPLTATGVARTFYLQRNEDWSGISGTGVVAVGFEFDHWTVLHWLDAQGATFWYPSVAMVEQVHGHEGRTLIVRCEMASSLQYA